MFVLTIPLISAQINDTFHLNIQTTYANGSIETGTFAFGFNLTESSDPSCLGPVVYNHSTTLATDVRGIISLYLPTVGSGGGNLSQLNFDTQYHLCYYRDGSLKDVTLIGRVPYAFRATQVNLSEISIDSDLDMGGWNITGVGTGFFDFLGSLANRITSLFVQDVDVSGDAEIAGNLTVGTDVLFVDSSGDVVGIGTVTPQNTLNVIGDINATGAVYGNFIGDGSGLTNVSAEDIDGYPADFFMPLNKSVFGTFDFNDGWTGGGLSIIGGDIFAQTGYFVNISSLSVTHLNVNGSVIPAFDVQFDLGSAEKRWNELFVQDINVSRDIFVGRDADISGDLDVGGDVDVTGNVSASWFKGAFDWMIGAASQIYLSFNGTQLDFDESALNVTIDSRISEAEGTLHVNVSDWWNTGDRGALRNISQIQGSWLTNDLSWINFTDGDGRYILLTNEPNLNVNRSDWWSTTEGDLKNVEDILGSWLTNDLQWINFSQGDTQYLLITNEGNLNVNSSNFWITNEGIKENVVDILGSEITNDLGWVNFSQADERYDARYVNITGDTMTGSLAIDANLTVGTDVLFVDSSGSLVGIGTTTPQNNLNVIGDGNFTEGKIYGANNIAIDLGKTYSDSFTFYSGSDYVRFRFEASQISAYTSKNIFQYHKPIDVNDYIEAQESVRIVGTSPELLLSDSDGKLYYIRSDGDQLRFYEGYGGSKLVTYMGPTGKWWFNDTISINTTDTSQILNIGGSANVSGNLFVGNRVGIGTSSPQNNLNVIGDINATETIYAGEFSGAINWTNLQNYPVGCGVGQAVQVIGDTLTCIDVENATTLDGYPASFFMPLNTSVYGNFDFNDGWTGGGLSIVDGDIFAQTLYVYNITSLNVSHLNINGSLLPQEGFDNQFDIGSAIRRWRDLFIGRDASIGGNLNVGGTGIFGGQINMSGNRIINLGNGTSAQDAVTLSQLQSVNATATAPETDPVWTSEKGDYFTSAEILAFGYYNETDFVITDYFTKSDILGFGYYNLSDFDISDYFTSSEILAFNYYNLTDFDISDYFTAAEILGFNYYNATDFVITDYYTKLEVYNKSEIDAMGFLDEEVDPHWTGNYTGLTAGQVLFGQLQQDTALHWDNTNKRLGIGTTAPHQKLHVNGSVVFNGTLNMDSNKIISLANGTAAQDAVTLSQLQAVNGTAGFTKGTIVQGTGMSLSGTLTNRLVDSGDVTFNLANTAVTPGTYGGDVVVGRFTVDQQGRITNAGNVSIRTATTGQTGITQLTASVTSTANDSAATPWGVKVAYDTATAKASPGTCPAGYVVQNTTTGGVQCVADQDTTYSASGILLNLTGTTFKVNEGTLTTGKGCKYVSGTGLVCDQDYLTSFTETDPKWTGNWSTRTGTGNVVFSTSPILTTPNIGAATAGGILNMSSYRIISLANATDSQDAVTLSQLQAVNATGNVTGSGTANRLAYWTGTSKIAALAAGNAGQILRSGGSGSASWSTATYPSTASNAGKILRADGTNWVESTTTYPNTVSANQALYATSANVIGAGTLPLAAGGTGATSYGANRIIFMNSGNNAFSSNGNFVFDGTNMGIGTVSPNSKLEVAGTFNATSNGGSMKVDSNGNVKIGI